MLKIVYQLAKNRLHVSSAEFRLIMLAPVLFTVAGMAFVWPTVRTIDMAYESQSLKREHRDLLRENQLLKLEKESLQSLYRIESLAKTQLGLKKPGKTQLVTIFVK